VASLLAAALLGSAAPSRALQVLEARDGVAVEAIVSVKEATRIRIDGAPIIDVFGNIHTSTCAPPASTAPASASIPGTPVPLAGGPVVNPAGELILECDREKGEIYVRPVGDSTKPVNLFISSAHATYTLILRRADTPADTIVIRDRSARSTNSALPSLAGSNTPAGTSANHIRAMKALLVAMATDRIPTDIRVEDVHRPLQLWTEARFALMRRYEGRGLVGELYQLQNVSATVMVLAEQEFDRPDSKEGGQVLGIAIEHHNLRPGDSTVVFVIRRGGAQ
jgi:conjugal transfer pilus assembly protein TraK